MEIRKTKMSDLEKIKEIYSFAREQMKLNGNPNQWGEFRPSENTIIDDIKNGNSYVIEEDGIIYGVFAFIIGPDPTYQVIDGAWKNDEEYGTIHRIASSGVSKGVLKMSLDYCEKQISNIRVDTHEDNKIMQHLLEKNGFQRCGIIHIADGSPRIAYQKTL